MGLLFSVYVWMDAQRKEAVETEKAATFEHRLADMLNIVNAVAAQSDSIVMLASRDEVTKQELKHLVLAQKATVNAAQDGLARIRARESEWKFGTSAL